MKLAVISESDEENNELIALVSKQGTIQNRYTEFHKPIWKADRLNLDDYAKKALNTFAESANREIGMTRLLQIMAKEMSLKTPNFFWKDNILSNLPDTMEFMEVPIGNGNRKLFIIRKKQI